MAETRYLQVHNAVNQMITALKNIADPLETLFARWLTLKTTLKRKKLSACLVESATYELTSAPRKINEGLLIGRYKSQVTGHCFGLFQYW